MYKFKILVEGYAKPCNDGKYYASPTTTLIYKDDFKLLVDPGTNSLLLKDSLKKENLKPEDIKYIFLTHYHPDHFLNLKLFPNAILIDGSMVWDNDSEEEHNGKLLDTDIEIVATPGHTLEHASLLFRNEEYGDVFLCQDVFWWEDGNQNTDNLDTLMNNLDPFMNNWEDLLKSRQLVLSKADWIIPGHGKMFKNKFKNLNK